VTSTCVFVHAHPDDEALLTAGTMAALAARGCRVVLVVATAGEQGLAGGQEGDLGRLRLSEVHASARALGCARTEFLGFADSGLHGDAAPPPGAARRFVDVPVEEAAQQLARLLVEEDTRMVTGYDAAGGYGHPDHVHLHSVVRRAAALAGTPSVYEATVDREALRRALRLLAALRVLPPELDLAAYDQAYTPSAEITHRVDVRSVIDAKRAALAAHTSQTGGGDSVRTLAALLRLPGPLFRLALGTEWFVRRVPSGPAGGGP
jgi:LmbE family N-acetylglucosaminyl deacetylase